MLRPKDMMLSVDAMSGDVMLAFSDYPVFFHDVEELEALLDTIHSALPRLRAARAAAIGIVESEQESETPGWEIRAWEVSVTGIDIELDPEEAAERISAATGWSMLKSAEAYNSGPPIVLGSHLNVIDAMRLQKAAEFNGLTAEMFRPNAG